MKRIALLSMLALGANAASAEELSEQDYFTELPVVLSVSRLAQPLNEAPGAVTVIDRDIIRRSGARTVAEVLRLVPGVIVGYAAGSGRPVANYHAEFDDVPHHLQVFIDGRSTYSSLLLGSATYGMLGVVMEDIERIEVLRGSNSAAYGANAFLGVVNIVTRHAADTPGGMVALNSGDGGVNDLTARLGWGDERAAFRVSLGRRGDDGFRQLYDASRFYQAHFRGDLHPGPADDITLAAGRSEFRWGVPEVPNRDESWVSAYAQAQWRHRLGEDEALRFRAQFDTEAFRDFYPLLRADGRSGRMELEAEHSFAAGAAWRFVWGGQYRREEVNSSDLFNGGPAQQFGVWRLFGNAEWRPHPQWLVNLGGLWERHGIAGQQSAPRLMVNFHALPGHTVRLGTTTAHKQPTLFELRSDWRAGNTPVIRASGAARAETIESTELGYLGQFRSVGVTVDVRAFHEKARDLLRFARPCGACPNDLINKDPNTQRGWETQLRWQPLPATQVLLNYTALRLVPDEASTTPQDQFRAPQRYATLALFQALPDAWDLALIHVSSAAYFVVRQADMIPAYRQTDLRLARRFRLGATRAEAALTVRAVDGNHVAYVQRDVPPIVLDNRAHLSLRLDF